MNSWGFDCSMLAEGPTTLLLPTVAEVSTVFPTLRVPPSRAMRYSRLSRNVQLWNGKLTDEDLTRNGAETAD